ncbi:MAG TPA: tRNA(Met) cytidine acetyltransferase, partial [Candidatus Nanopusillus sp.]|nr:tRNA(Met) cytidine acetyltransferase [Candidatus Nanopusillus sp.]
IMYNFKSEVIGLYVTEDYHGDYLKRYSEFKDLINREDLSYLKIKRGKYRNSKEYMGKTYDFLILDMYRSLTPDDLGRLVGTVRGGGVIFMLIEDFENFEQVYTTFHKHLLTPPYELKDVRKIFEKRFKRKLLEHRGIYIYDVKKGVIKGPEKKVERDVIFPERKKIILPSDTLFSERIYRVAYTQDQIEVLKLLEGLLDKDRKAYVVIADRGRGKSAVLGLAIAGLTEILLDKKGKWDIGITSPSFDNIETLFEFLEIGLKKLNINFKKVSKKKLSIKNKIFIEYREPLNILDKKYNFLFVDEAAGISVTILYDYLKKYKKLVFSSTIHGYEGAGRSFSVRFLKHLKENTNFKVYEYKMKEPIRYNDNDPIEKWLFDTLLLDAEPAHLDEKDLQQIKEKATIFYKIPLEKWFEKEEEKLRQFVGIYILAHYQNRPNDIAMIADAPHHDGFSLELGSNKIVTAIQVAYEGNIPEDTIKRMLKDYKPKGNIIPDVIAKHYRETEFPKLKGLRIVRIATHPEAQGKGLGSTALRELSIWAENIKYNWLGSGFGATVELLRFWQKNGFVVVHISPEKNRVSGEYSVIVLKPLDEKTNKIVRKLNYEFRWRFLNQITDVFFDMTPELIWQLLQTPYEHEPHFNPLLTDNQIQRAKVYFRGPMTYEAAADIVRNLTTYYFMYTKKDRPKLTKEEELLLISKIYLAWSMRKVAKYFDIKVGEARRKIKKGAKKIFNWLKEK